MTVMAWMMFLSLILLIINSVDPRFTSKSEIMSVLFKLGIGSLLGFCIILLYGVGLPGLKYFFYIIGIGGIAHLFLLYKATPVAHA